MTSSVSPEATVATATTAQTSSASDLTLVDYFVLVGYDNTPLLQIELGGTNSDPSELLYIPPLQRSYVASVLHYFPKRRSAYSFPTEIVSVYIFLLPKNIHF
uniref:DUF1618 domain-containing protein n=1 Tax=Setaria digitata TaxID=48799 RepID=A0A915Q166_9BILA